MNRKKIEDFKLSGNKTLKIPKEDIQAKEAPIYVNPKEVPNYINKKESPAHDTPYVSRENSPKYDFLKKLNKNTASISQRIPQTPKLPQKNKPIGRKIAMFILLLIAIGSIYLLNTLFYNAKVTIVPKNKIFELNNQKFTAEKFKKDSVPFEVMIVSDNDSKDVVLTSSSNVSSKATGEIILYNEYSNKSQKITAGTFISDDKGKSYKIDSTVTVPAYSLDNKKIIPGQINVKITSFIAGDTYNGSPELFHIVSFKGTNKYEKIYGKIKTPLSGGMAGLVYILDEKEKESVLSNTISFKERLLRNLKAQTPQGYIYYPDGVSFSFDFGENITSKTPVAKIEMNGTLSAILFKETDLTDYILKKILPDISPKEKGEILPPDLSNLSFSFFNKGQQVSKEVTNFDFILNGNLQIDWNPNTDELKSLLLGKDKSEVPSIFKQDPGISSATIRIFPFWFSKFPNELKNINILFK
jgi:hypothetical protein